MWQEITLSGAKWLKSDLRSDWNVQELGSEWNVQKMVILVIIMYRTFIIIK